MKKSGWEVIRIRSINTNNIGSLSFFESKKDVPFMIKRIYYISRVPEGVTRGFHAHKKLKQLLFCPYGEIKLVLDNGINKTEFILNDPSIGVIIDKPVWREMVWLKTDSVLCVAASDFYKESDYLRDYTSFIKYLEEDN